MEYITRSEKETFCLAQKMAKQFTGSKIIGLTGDLGAGKTIFTKGLAAGLGIKKTITSPTFVLMKVYSVKNLPRIKNFVHIDAYRIKKNNDLIAIGVKDYIDRSDTVVVVEWADKIKKVLPERTSFVNIKHRQGEERIIKLI